MAITGQPVTLNYFIGGYVGSKHANVNTVTIDWDIKNPNDKIEKIALYRGGDQSAFFNHHKNHTYTLPSTSDREYTAKITVVGDNDPDESHAHSFEAPILITAAAKPFSVSFLAGDKLLDIDQSGTWKMKITGGVPPYDIDMYWGDGKIISRKDTYVEEHAARHIYTEAKKYTIRVEVHDAKYYSAFAEYIADVWYPYGGEETVWGSHLYDAEWYAH